MLYAIILLLVEKGVLKEDEAKLWFEKLRVNTLPGDYNSARATMARIAKEIEKESVFLE